MGSIHLMALQKEHDILDLLLLLPALLNPFYADLPYPFHRNEFIRRILNHIQRILSELLDDPLCKLRSDAFN